MDKVIAISYQVHVSPLVPAPRAYLMGPSPSSASCIDNVYEVRPQAARWLCLIYPHKLHLGPIVAPNAGLCVLHARR